MSTIFAPLTLKGKCSIYVLRISGNKTLECLQKFGVNKKLKHREATICALKNTDGSVLDEVVATYFIAPNSFTGEDICEISFHCSNYIINQAFSILLSVDDVRLAEPGEFSKIAFLNGKMDLMQAEAVADLINSETELQHKFAINQLEGKNSDFYNDLRKELVEILSLVESYIDFPEDDIPKDILKNIGKKISELKKEMETTLNDSNIGERIKDGFKIAVFGEPNVGKSTLINYLAGRDIAIVSEIEGTTRDVLEVALNINGIPVTFYDTAGIRGTFDSIEKEGVRRALIKVEEADIRIFMISLNRIEFGNDLVNLVDKNTLILVNKMDLGIGGFDSIKSRFPNNDVIGISLEKNTNLDIVIKNINSKLENIVSPHMNSTITNERCRKELTESLKYLSLVNFLEPVEINAENIRQSANCIGRITGSINVDEILDNIFSKFCIGK